MLALFVMLTTTACTDKSSPAVSTAGDATVVDDSGTYRLNSGDTCCGPGKALSCCTAEAGLLGYERAPDGAWYPVGDRPGPVKEANCYTYGGPFGACVAEGHTFDGKMLCAICCEGLSRQHRCDDIFFTCMACGNGVWDPGEDHCGCPEDCPYVSNVPDAGGNAPGSDAGADASDAR